MRSVVVALVARYEHRNVVGRSRKPVDEVAYILRTVCNMTSTTPLASLQTIDTHDRGSPGNEHYLDLGESTELCGNIPQFHVAFV